MEHLMFRKSNCGIVVRNYNLNAGTLEFEISDKSQAEVLASSFSKILKRTSILLATVQPVKWFAELEVREYRDGKPGWICTTGVSYVADLQSAGFASGLLIHFGACLRCRSPYRLKYPLFSRQVCEPSQLNRHIGGSGEI